jgi:cation:H+ antiporter
MAALDQILTSFLATTPGPVLFLFIVVLLVAMGKGADVLVDQAVYLAGKTGIPKVLIGATIVSLGTTTPETAVSVMAAIQGEPGLALGNAVGSIIADTGLILGIACLISPPLLDRTIVNRQGWIQVGAGVLLVALSFVFGSRLPRGVGFLFLTLLVLYIWTSIRWTQGGIDSVEQSNKIPGAPGVSTFWVITKLLLGVFVVLVTSHFLVPAVENAAFRLSVPQDIIAATLVALGTSLPELVTAVTASLKRHGEVALGNVIGADILNILFVTGAACAVTPGGLAVPATFFSLHFPFMIGIFVVFRLGIFFSKERLGRGFGALMVGIYACYLIAQAMVAKAG